MPLGEEIRGHLPYLRRYARALTGSQQHGDNFVHTTLEVIVAAPNEFSGGHGARIDLYRNFHRIWESAYIDDGEGSDDGEDPRQCLVMAAKMRVIEHRPFRKGALRDRPAADFDHAAVARIGANDGQAGIDLVGRPFQQLHEIMAVEDKRPGQGVALVVAARLHQKFGNILFADHRIGNADVNDG